MNKGFSWVSLLSSAVMTVALLAGASVQAQTAAPASAPAASAATDASAVAAIKAPAAAAEENPYGLKALWGQGDWVAKGTLVILLIMSMGSWYIMVTKFLEQKKLMTEAKQAQEQFWAAGSTEKGLATLTANGAYQHVVQSGVTAAQKHAAVAQEVDLKTWLSAGIERSTVQVQSRLQEGLAFLATVGSTSPFVGLFGTVWGIYNALVKIGTSGQASIDKVAGPVGEALIMTAIGLAVAVPAVLSYNWLVRRNKAAMEQLREFGSDLHSQLLAKK